MKHYAGLDVSMKETFICVQDCEGKVIHQGHTKTDPDLIFKYLTKIGVPLTKVAIESSSLSHWLVEELCKKGLPSICIDARKMAAILSVQVNKTDTNDAKGIADAVRCHLYREVAQKSQASIEISMLMGCRRLLVAQKVQQTNTIRGFLKRFGIRLGAVGDANFTKIVRAHLADKSEVVKQGLDSLLTCYQKIYEEIKKLTKKIEGLARQDEDVKRFTTIPGVGAITGLAFKVEIDNPYRFKDSRAVGAYLGMTPKQYSSGEIQRQGAISKCGSSEMRFLLSEAGTVMLLRSQRWNKIKAWGLKIFRKKGAKKAAMAVGRKIAVIMHQMWINKTEFIYREEPKKKQIA